jgi:uncharacterized membrane protein YfcA
MTSQSDTNQNNFESSGEILENLFRNGDNLKEVAKTEIIVTKTGIKKKLTITFLYSLVVMVIMVIGHLLVAYVPLQDVKDLGNVLLDNLDKNFALYVLGGFVAQMIDGALGMAYGVSVTSFLLSLGIPAITPAIASASMHASEIFTTGSSSLVYMRYKNVNKKMFKKLVVPGILGAVLGAVSVALLSKDSFLFIKPLVAFYSIILGGLIIIRALNINLRKTNKIRKIFPVALFGGFLDSVGGGGWGPIVTTSLVAGGRNLRYSIGSSHLAKFFVAGSSTITFFLLIGLSHWQIIFGLVIGGMIAAPISIYFSSKIPTKKGLIMVGIMVILISLRTIIKSIWT